MKIIKNFGGCLFLSCTLFSVAYATEKTLPELKIEVQASVPGSLSLPEAITLALQNNFKLKAGRAEVSMVRAAIATAGARQNPVLQAFESRAENAYSGGINYLFETAGKRRKRIQVAKNEFKAAEKEFEVKEHDLQIRVRQLYSKLAIDIDSLGALEEELKLANELTSAAKGFAKTGLAQTADLQLAAQNLIQLEADLINLKNEIQQSCIALNGLLQLEPLTSWKPTTSLVDLLELGELKPYPEIVAIARRERADLQKLNYELRAAEAELELAKAKRIPDVQENFAVVAANGLNLNPNSADVFTVNVRTDTSVELPAFNRQQGPIAEARAKIKKLSFEYSYLEREIANEVSAVLAEVESAQAKIALLQNASKLNREIADAKLADYQAGRASLPEVVFTKQNLETSRKELQAALLNKAEAISSLEEAIDAPLDEVKL